MYIMLNYVSGFGLHRCQRFVIHGLKFFKLRQSRFKWKATSFLLNPLISVGSSLFGTLTRRSFELNEWSAVLRGNL